MISCFTGLPGHGKTLYALWTIEAIRLASVKEAKEKNDPSLERQVFSCAMHPPDAPERVTQIPELSLPWHFLSDPKAWESCPPNSIVVIDEAQFLFPNRPHKEKPAPFIERLAVHRHSGIDIVLITQDAMNIDHFARRLVGRHVHLERKFGTHRSRVFEWPTVQKAGDYFARKQASASWFRFPKKAFSWYHSTEQDTVKSNFPWFKVAAVAALCLLLVFIVFLTIRFVLGWDDRAQQHTALYSESPSMAPGGFSAAPARRPRLDASPWVDGALLARLDGFLHTAPFYDGLMSPNSFPRIAGCARMDIGRVTTCECTSQQGTVLPLSVHQCIQVMRKGWFDFTQPDREMQQRSSVQAVSYGASAADSLLLPNHVSQ